jgi:hypothetical protein
VGDFPDTVRKIRRPSQRLSVFCADHGGGVAKYALPGLSNRVLAARYRTALPSEATLVAEMDHTRKMLEDRRLT